MEELRLTVERVAAQLQDRMAMFEEAQKSASAQAVVSSGLPADYVEFKTFVADALSLLQRQVELLAADCDGMEMRTRRKMILLHGVAEAKDENAVDLALRVTRDSLALPGATCDTFSRVQRLGRPAAKPRPLLIKFRSVETRDKAWFAKTKLKGSGITVSEFLTKRRHDVFVAARERYGTSGCWTREGVVIVLDANGKRHRVTSLSGLQCIPGPKPPPPMLRESPAKKPSTPSVAAVPASATARSGSSSGPSLPLIRKAKAAAKSNLCK